MRSRPGAHPVVVAAFRSPDEASAARSFLLREKIPANMMPRQDAIERLCPDMFDDGFDVVVEAEHAVDAIALLQRLFPEKRAIDAQLVDRCENCGSTDVLRIPKIRIFIAAAIALIAMSLVFGQRDLFLLVIAIIGGALLLTPRLRCRNC